MPQQSVACVRLAWVLLALCASPLLASEAEFLIWSRVHIVATESTELGRVSFSAEVADGQWKNVQVEAFGQSHSLDSAQCALLQGFPLESIRSTHEGGFPALGGTMVNFAFRKTTLKQGVHVDSVVVISITRGRGLTVHPPQVLEAAGL